MSLVLIDKIEHLVVVVAGIASLTLLCLFANLSTDVAVPIIASLAGLSSAAAVKQAVSSGGAASAPSPPPSGGVQAAGGPGA